MKNSFYIATASMNGLEKGEYYFVEDDRKVHLQNGKRIPFFTLRKILKPIPYYDGKLKENWQEGKTDIKMEVHDFIWYEEVIVKLIKIKHTKKGMVYLAKLPGSEEYVQIDTYYKMVA